MILDPADTVRFYTIWFPLLHFVSQRKGIIPHFPSTYGADSVSPNDAVALRDALWADDSLREAFIAENPVGLGAADLALVASWKTRIVGNFYFFRQLKKHAVFIPERGNPLVYGVLGLTSPIDECVPVPPPCMISTTLLPFDGKIIYDSLMQSYNIYFGSGITSSLNETYKAAKERGRLITNLAESDGGSTPEAIRKRNSKLLVAFQKHITRANTSLKTLEAHRATIERFGEDYLLHQISPRSLIETTAEDLAHYLETLGGKVNLTSFKHFVRFLRDTNRVPWEGAETMLSDLRG
jgi:hypothetical protein